MRSRAPGARPAVLFGLAAFALAAGAARGQTATVVNAHSAAIDPALDQAALEAWALALPSRTDLLDHVGRDTPGVVLEGDGLSIHGSRPRETQLLLDGVRVSRLRAPAAMLQGLQVARAGYGAALADVTGGAVGAATQLTPARWRGTVDLYSNQRDFPEPQDRALSAVAAGPIAGGRVQLLVSGQTEEETYDPRHDPASILPATPEVTTRRHRGGLRLGVDPVPGQRLELLAVGSFTRRDNTTTLGFADDAQPRWEERHGLLALRWRAAFANRWRAGAHLGVERTTTREFPRQCLTRPDCDQIPRFELFTPAGWSSFGNFDHRFEQRESGLDGAGWLQLDLPERGRWRSSLRLGSRLQAATLARERLIPGSRVDQFVLSGSVILRDARVTYFDDDPLTPLPQRGPFRSRMDTLQALQFVEWPMQLWSRLHLQPGLGLATARGSGSEHHLAASTVTPNLAASYQVSRSWGIWLRASSQRRVDSDLRPLLELAVATPVSQHCRYNTASGAFDTGCVLQGGEPVSIGLPCGYLGVDQQGTPCRQSLSLPRTWEHTLGAGADLFGGVRLDLDAVYRRTSGHWVRFETNRVWNIVGQDALFLRFRDATREQTFDISAPGGASGRHRALTTSLARPGRRVALALAHTYSHTQVTLHPLQGLVMTDDDRGRHFVHLQAIWNLWGHGSLAARYRYAQGVPLVPLFRNQFFGTYERYRSGTTTAGLQSGAPRGRGPGEKDLGLQVRASLRRLTGIDAQAYADAVNLLGKDEPLEIEQRVGPLYGTLRSFPGQRWYRIGLQAGF